MLTWNSARKINLKRCPWKCHVLRGYFWTRSLKELLTNYQYVEKRKALHFCFPKKKSARQILIHCGDTARYIFTYKLLFSSLTNYSFHLSSCAVICDVMATKLKNNRTRTGWEIWIERLSNFNRFACKDQINW